MSVLLLLLLWAILSALIVYNHFFRVDKTVDRAQHSGTAMFINLGENREKIRRRLKVNGIFGILGLLVSTIAFLYYLGKTLLQLW